ncbi:MAG: hypothetical protein IPJ40_17885 [Saprospirales bacterium]|nr:hypothetical protein [Saprospirales bacterium]
MNGNIFLPGVAFRTASPFGFVPAETALDLSIVPAGGDPVTDNVHLWPAHAHQWTDVRGGG